MPHYYTTDNIIQAADKIVRFESQIILNFINNIEHRVNIHPFEGLSVGTQNKYCPFRLILSLFEKNIIRFVNIICV